MILSGRRIVQMINAGEMEIRPFHPEKLRINAEGQRTLSYGLSGCGYDMTIADDTKNLLILGPGDGSPLDPKKFDRSRLVRAKTGQDAGGRYVLIPSGALLLARSGEYFRIPVNVLVACWGKSSYARCGLVVEITPLEPGWRGYVTLELRNAGPTPLKVYLNEGVAQLAFFQADQDCEAYDGPYQDQAAEVIPARV